MILRALNRSGTGLQVARVHRPNAIQAIAITPSGGVWSIRSYANRKTQKIIEQNASDASKYASTSRNDSGPILNRTWGPAAPLETIESLRQKRYPEATQDTQHIPKLQSYSDSQQLTSPNSPNDFNVNNDSLAKEQNLSHANAQLGAASPNSPSSTQRREFSTSSRRLEPSQKTPKPSDVGKANAEQQAKPSAPPEPNEPEPATEPIEPSKPLPDLRQGIPSTFEQEYTGFKSHKRQEGAEAESNSTSLNITEDPEEGSRRSEDERQRAEYVSSIERRRLALAKYMYITFTAFAVTGSIFLGQNWATEEEAKKHPDAPNGWSPTAFYARIKERLSSKLGYYTEPPTVTLLPDADPNLQPPYTLVLSLEDLLVSSKWSRSKGWEVAKRPGVDYFLHYLHQYYELVVFTTVPSMNADMVLRKLDPYRLMLPLFKESTRYVDGENVKDLSYLNRDLSKVIIVDTKKSHTRLQPENAIILPKWTGKPGDAHANDLVALIPLLEFMSGMGVEDTRKVLKSYQGVEDIPQEFQRREAAARAAFQERMKNDKSKRGRSGMGSLSSAMGFKPSQPRGPGGVPTLEEGLAQGKMLSDLIREQGQLNYKARMTDLRERGDMILKEMAEEEKKAQEESISYVQKGFLGMFSGSGSQENEKN